MLSRIYTLVFPAATSASSNARKPLAATAQRDAPVLHTQDPPQVLTLSSTLARVLLAFQADIFAPTLERIAGVGRVGARSSGSGARRGGPTILQSRWAIGALR